MFVIPAKAGNQGPMQHIAGITAFLVARSCRLPWAPAYAGVTGKGVLVTEKGAVVKGLGGVDHTHSISV